jgi:endonuclease/exonuclease/phosphatase family metal-dependent hydrolase
MGDFNSYRQRQPRGSQWVLGKQGYRDAFTAKRAENADVPTVNVTTKYRDPFPAKPFHLDQPARLDYVFVEGGTPVRYELQLHLRNGKFDNRYRASDHNLVTAQLRLKNVPLPDRWK